MSNQVLNDLALLHPILIDACNKIQENIIRHYEMPFKLFETGRTNERQQILLSKGRTQNIFSKHLFSFEGDVPLYSVAVDYVYYNGKWSWNIRDQTIKAWYVLFGNMILDSCPELQWGGNMRKSENYTHFQLRENIVKDNFDKYPCILHMS